MTENWRSMARMWLDDCEVELFVAASGHSVCLPREFVEALRANELLHCHITPSKADPTLFCITRNRRVDFVVPASLIFQLKGGA